MFRQRGGSRGWGGIFGDIIGEMKGIRFIRE